MTWRTLRGQGKCAREKKTYLVRPGAAEVAMRRIAIAHINRLVELGDGFIVRALALKQLRQRKVPDESVALAIYPVRGAALGQHGVCGLVILAVDVRLREEEQLRAQGDVVGDELPHVLSQALRQQL